MTRRRQSQRKNATRQEFKVINQDLSGGYEVQMVAASIMKLLEGRVSPELLNVMSAMLLGFNDEMQLEIADDLLDFACGHVIHTTGCPTADFMLGACYLWIAEDQGLDTQKLVNTLMMEVEQDEKR